MAHWPLMINLPIAGCVLQKLSRPKPENLRFTQNKLKNKIDKMPIIRKLECGPMPNLMVALPNVAGALCSTPQSLADAHY